MKKPTSDQIWAMRARLEAHDWNGEGYTDWVEWLNKTYSDIPEMERLVHFTKLMIKEGVL